MLELGPFVELRAHVGRGTFYFVGDVAYAGARSKQLTYLCRLLARALVFGIGLASIAAIVPFDATMPGK